MASHRGRLLPAKATLNEGFRGKRSGKRPPDEEFWEDKPFVPGFGFRIQDIPGGRGAMAESVWPSREEIITNFPVPDN